MSDTSNVDNSTEPLAQSPSVAPPPGTGETQGSTPASVDTTASAAEDQTAKDEADKKAAEEEAEKVSRRERKALYAVRRENRELYRRLGGLEAMLQQIQQPPATEGNPQRQIQPPVNDAVDELNRSILEKIEDAGEEYEAVVEKIAAPNFPISVAMRDYLATAKDAAVVAKALADDPKEARRISLLSERAADRAMEQLEARVSAPKAPPRTTRAPPPVRTVGGSSSVRNEPGKMGMDEYVKWRNSAS